MPRTAIQLCCVPVSFISVQMVIEKRIVCRRIVTELTGQNVCVMLTFKTFYGSTYQLTKVAAWCLVSLLAIISACCRVLSNSNPRIRPKFCRSSQTLQTNTSFLPFFTPSRLCTTNTETHRPTHHCTVT